MLAAEPDVDAGDWRDALVDFAPFRDCARRLGADPEALFVAASSGRGSALRDLAATFARRSDITLEAFGWVVEDRPDGPCCKPRA